MGGVFAAIVQIFTLYVAPTSTSTAFLYFLIVAVLTALMLVYYLVASKREFYKYYYENDYIEEKTERSSFKEMLKKIWVATLALLIDTMVTHVIHPSITSVIISTDYGSGDAWSGNVHILQLLDIKIVMRKRKNNPFNEQKFDALDAKIEKRRFGRIILALPTGEFEYLAAAQTPLPKS